MKGRTNVSGNGNLEIDGDIELFEVAEGNNIIAGSFVESTGENASINQLKSISNSACGVAKISDDMIVLFSYVPKSTNLSASVVKGNEIIKTYNFVLDYHIDSPIKYIQFNTHVDDGKIYLSYGVKANNETGRITNEIYGTPTAQLVRNVTEIEFDEEGNLSKAKDYTVDFSGITNDYTTSTTSRTKHYTNNKFIFSNGYAYSAMLFSESSTFNDNVYVFLDRFAIDGSQLKYESCLLSKKLSDNNIDTNYFELFNGKILFSNVTRINSNSSSAMKIQFELYDIDSNSNKELIWNTEASGYYKNTKIIPNNNFIYTVCGEGNNSTNMKIYCAVFQINSDLSLSYVQENRSLPSVFSELFDCGYLENKNGNDYLLCYVTGSFTYKVYVIKYEPTSSEFSFSDFTLSTDNENLRMYSSTDDLLRFAIPLRDNEQRTVIYLKNGNSTTNSLIASNFIYQDEEIIFAEALDLVKNYESRINGVAQTSGSAGSKIQVKVPSGS